MSLTLKRHLHTYTLKNDRKSTAQNVEVGLRSETSQKTVDPRIWIQIDWLPD